MCSDVAISLKGVTKSYSFSASPSGNLLSAIGVNSRDTGFEALKNIDLEVRKGSTIGILGVNGSGKSTLLQIIAGIMKPTEGHVKVNGRISELLELGIGFDLELSGRKNVFLYGSLRGIPERDVEKHIAEIEKFADIGQHFDLPMRTYSTGMIVRVAFAAAIFMTAEILIIDEALAVGDEAFQRKCLAKIQSFKSAGRTILFVSHSTNMILNLCDDAILLDGGQILTRGHPKDVVNAYQKLQSTTGATRSEFRSRLMSYEVVPDSLPDIAPIETQSVASFDSGLKSETAVHYEDGVAQIANVRILDREASIVNLLTRGEEYTLKYEVEFSGDAKNIGFGMLFKTLDGTDFAGSSTAFEDSLRLSKVANGEAFDVEFAFRCNFEPGTYLLNVGVVSAEGLKLQYQHRILDALLFKVLPDKRSTATSIVDIGIRPRVKPFSPN